MTSSTLPGSIGEPEIDWAAARLVTFAVHQSLRYEYPGPISDLHQLLALVPPDITEGQRLLSYQVEVRPAAHPVYAADQFGNRLCRIFLPVVEKTLEIDVDLRINRWPMPGREPLGPGEERLFRIPSPLTEPGPAILAAASAFDPAESPAALAERINAWVHGRLVYTAGVTGIETTAEAALQLGAGVCQDYAHLMLALCRHLGLPARYVSGHLLGEGSMHAWAEVLLPNAAWPDLGRLWQAFDPTHGGRAGLRHLLIAAGRDYGDVSPTRGTFRAPFSGHLSYGSKRASVVAVE
jgi:transglutaminase-like putative cysteine protease